MKRIAQVVCLLIGAGWIMQAVGCAPTGVTTPTLSDCRNWDAFALQRRDHILDGHMTIDQAYDMLQDKC